MKKQLIVKSSTNNLSLIRQFVQSTAEEFGINKEVAGKLILSVDEACTNIIKHAYTHSTEGEIIVDIFLKQSSVVVKITDSGINFNPDSVPPPNIQEFVKQRRHGGLGMFLMKKLMDEVSYDTLSKGRNRVKLVKYI